MTDHHAPGAPTDPREWLAAAAVDAAVFALQPDYRTLLTADGLRGGLSDAVSAGILADAEASARRQLDGRPPEQLPHPAAWREAYRAFGAKRSAPVPAWRPCSAAWTRTDCPASTGSPTPTTPVVIPTHISVEDTPAGTVLLVHLARPNPVWRHIDADPHVVVTVVDDYAYIPTTRRARAGGPDEDGVPTSYCAAVQLRCHAEIVDDPAAKADLLAHFQPVDDHPEVAVGAPPYGRMLPASAGCACTWTGSTPSSSTTTPTPPHTALRPPTDWSTARTARTEAPPPSSGAASGASAPGAPDDPGTLVTPTSRRSAAQASAG